MDLLPSSHTEFSRPDYWDRFFKKRGQIPFEWYGEYPQLYPIIHKYISPSNLVLVVGCGNSALSENMYDNGLQNLSNIDISDVVIRQMIDRHREKRPKMTFEQMDVTGMSYSDGHFHAVLDKGTLDALLVSEETEVVAKVNKMFEEVSRSLRFGGRYIIISLLQDHVQRTLLHYFTQLGWPIRVHRVKMEAEAASKTSVSMPVFAVVITKLKAMPNMPQIVEVCRFEDRIDRLEDVKYLSEIIKDMQYYHMVQQQLRSRLPEEQQVSLELHSKDMETPRYQLTVVDAKVKATNKFGIFIVPQGRENEWLFSTDKGRQHLQASADFQRLVVVTLNRGHNYENLDAIKAELSNRVMELAPGDISPKAQVPFLSIGEDIGKRRTVAKGHSDMTGEYLVEDVEVNGGQVFRRLIFLDNKIITQSEARMTEGRKKKHRSKTGEGPSATLKVDKGYLPCEYLIAAVGGLAFLPSLDGAVHGLILGLGGGSLACFIHEVFPQVTLDTVELDPSVVDIARTWFGLKPDDRLRVHVADGLTFVRDLVSAGEKRDVIVLDIDSKDHTVGLNCPPQAFVEPEFLQLIATLLSENGVFIMNLASRDDSVGEAIIQRVSGQFPSCGCLRLQEDINILMYMTNRPPSDPGLHPEALTQNFMNMDRQIKAKFKDTNVDLEDMMSGLTFQH